MEEALDHLSSTSSGTVERHVGGIFGKLGYRSRVELASAVSRGRLDAVDAERVRATTGA